MTIVREAVRAAWVALAGCTLGAALRVWYPIHKAALVAAGGDDERLTDWSTAQARAMGGFVLVAALNLLAGVVAYLTPPRPDARWPPKERVDWVPIALPAIFILSAVVKLSIVTTIWRAYQRVTRSRSGA